MPWDFKGSRSKFLFGDFSCSMCFEGSLYVQTCLGVTNGGFHRGPSFSAAWHCEY
jgi:hypothetical protein